MVGSVGKFWRDWVKRFLVIARVVWLQWRSCSNRAQPGLVVLLKTAACASKLGGAAEKERARHVVPLREFRVAAGCAALTGGFCWLFSYLHLATSRVMSSCCSCGLKV